MFKDYYLILNISPCATNDEIKSAYRNMSKRWHPDRNPGVDVTNVMQNINEAYAILKDPEKKNRYDSEYRRYQRMCQPKYNTERSCTENWTQYDVNDETVKNDINEAREYARNLVDEFMNSLRKTSKEAAMGAWNESKVYFCAGVIFVMIVLFVRSCK